METIIQSYHERIGLTPLQLYSVILKYKPSYTLRRESGFPVTSPNFPNQVISRFSYSTFNSSPDPSRQQCKRCRKPLSLLEEDWYLDEAGCSYHPGKRTFCGGPDNGLYSCCKGISDETGCAGHEHHVCEFRPVDGGNFVRAARRRYPGVETLNAFALDCEMVYTAIGMEVVRVSVVSIYGDTVYDSLVLPENLVLDFNTAFSGVKAEDLEDVTTTLADAQNSLLELLNTNSILIGHGLENDLLGLHLFHQNVVDTSLVFGHERGFPFRHSLRTLASRYLQTTIHSDTAGHNSIEDAKASLALVLHKVLLETQECHFLDTRHVDSRFGYRYDRVPNVQAPSFVFQAFDPTWKPMVNVYGNMTRFPPGPNVVVVPNYVHFQTPVLPIIPLPSSV